MGRPTTGDSLLAREVNKQRRPSATSEQGFRATPGGTSQASFGAKPGSLFGLPSPARCPPRQPRARLRVRSSPRLSPMDRRQSCAPTPGTWSPDSVPVMPSPRSTLGRQRRRRPRTGGRRASVRVEDGTKFGYLSEDVDCQQRNMDANIPICPQRRAATPCNATTCLDLHRSGCRTGTASYPGKCSVKIAEIATARATTKHGTSRNICPWPMSHGKDGWVRWHTTYLIVQSTSPL